MFIGFITNPNWPEICEAPNVEEEPRDKPDLCVRIFKMKLDALIDENLKNDLFGRIFGYSLAIEWQNWGLTYAHILLILKSECKPTTSVAIDKIISAEFLDPKKNYNWFKTVITSMINGPCGSINPSCPCMQGSGDEKHCSKRFLEPYVNEQTIHEDCVPEYRRGSLEIGGYTAVRTLRGLKITIGNSWVVHYNPYLIRKTSAHRSCEIINSVEAFKYLYKYILKGGDRKVMNLKQTTISEDARSLMPAIYQRVNCFGGFMTSPYTHVLSQLKSFPVICQKEPLSFFTKVKYKKSYGMAHRRASWMHFLKLIKKTYFHTIGVSRQSQGLHLGQQVEEMETQKTRYTDWDR